MKYFFFIVLCFSISKVFAQGSNTQKVDSIYYLLDTANTPAHDRLWKVMDATPSFKSYTFQCPCLENQGTPSFGYEITNKKDELINANQLKKLKLINLVELLKIAKKLDSVRTYNNYDFFLIIPEGSKYIIHNVSFFNPAIHIVSPPDLVVKEIDTTILKLPGVVQADAKALKKYIGKTVITSARVMGTKEAGADNIAFLFMGANYPDQDFTILVNEKNPADFYPMKSYTNHWVRVTGKVTMYAHKPAIVIFDEKQIR